MKPSIAVVISTYNSPDFLRLVLNAYAHQSDQHFSVYVADDGSSDETRTMVEGMTASFPVPLHHIWHEDCGFRKSRIHNQAFQQVAEDYILLTDGDCIPLPDLIATHRRYAERKTMLSGSRILLSQAWTKSLKTSPQFPNMTALAWFKLAFQKKINRLLPLFIPPYTSSAQQKLSGIHGCHLSLFKDDLIRINGFDESFEGWGREDSDLVARLFHAGVQRKNLRGMPVLHLWHRENDRQNLEKNDALLQACLQEKRVYARQGLKELPSDGE